MSSDINSDGVSKDGRASQEWEAICQRLALLSSKVETQLSSEPESQQQIFEELQAVLAWLQATQNKVQPPPSVESEEVKRLQALLHQKEILLREIHHRVKNNLQIVSSLLDLQVMRTDDAFVQELLRNNQSRIYSIALVHERLSQAANLTEISLGDYVRGLVVTLVRLNTLNFSQVTLNIEIDSNLNVLPDRAIPIGLILNELISNALKHGLLGVEGEIVIKLDHDPTGQATLSVSNTGNRLPADFDPIASNSLGFQLIHSLVKQINGTLQVEQGNQTTFQVQFNALGDR
jgi:two-component sensor histidine kinase